MRSIVRLDEWKLVSYRTARRDVLLVRFRNSLATHWNIDIGMARIHRRMMGYKIIFIIAIPTMYLIFANALAAFLPNNAASASSPTNTRKCCFSSTPRFFLRIVPSFLPSPSFLSTFSNREKQQRRIEGKKMLCCVVSSDHVNIIVTIPLFCEGKRLSRCHENG